MKMRTVQVVITTSAVLVAVVHVLYPSLTIDGITLVLLIVAAIPWLAPLFKSLQFPGGWKIEFQDLQKAREDADRAGLLAAAPSTSALPDYSFQLVAADDPNLALAGLRIEIEKRLAQLAQAHALKTDRTSAGRLLRVLAEANVLSQEERGVLADMMGLLNSAVHGATVDIRAAEWAMEVGPRVLQALDAKIE